MKNLNSVINKYRRALSNTLLMDVERYEPGINSYYTVVTSLGKNISIAMMNPIKTSCGFKEELHIVPSGKKSKIVKSGN